MSRLISCHHKFSCISFGHYLSDFTQYFVCPVKKLFCEHEVLLRNYSDRHTCHLDILLNDDTIILNVLQVRVTEMYYFTALERLISATTAAEWRG